MKRTFVALLALVAVCSWALAATPPETKTFEAKNGNVTFPHKAHVSGGIKCTECHHAGKMDACSSCHTAEAKDKQPKLHDAIHGKGKFSCATCHAAKVAEGKKAPKTCTDCHKKA